MSERSVNDVLKTQFCRAPGCPEESDFNSGPCEGLCRKHAERTVREKLPMIAARLAARATPALWTRDEIVAAMKAWAEEYGVPPYGAQWRYAGEGRPTANTVRSVFGSWDAALEAAGLENGRTTTLTVAWEDEVPREQVHERSRELASAVAEEEGVAVAHLHITRKADDVDDSPEPEDIQEEERVAVEIPDETPDPDRWLGSEEAEILRLEYIGLLLRKFEALPTYPVDLMDRIERLLWGRSFGQRAAKP